MKNDTELLSASQAFKLSKEAVKAEDMQEFMEAIAREARLGNTNIYLSHHHANFVPRLESLGYSCYWVSDENGAKLQVSWSGNGSIDCPFEMNQAPVFKGKGKQTD